MDSTERQHTRRPGGASVPRGAVADRSRRGLSVVELLCALTLGILLIVTLAGDAFELPGREAPAYEVAVLAPDAGLAYLADAVRHAWQVEVPGPTRLLVTDTVGRTTAFALQGEALRVTHPTGETDELLTDVEDLRFEVDTFVRHREGEPREERGELWARRPASGAVRGLVVREGQELGLGFTLDEATAGLLLDDPLRDGPPDVLLDAALERLELRIARVDGRGPEFCHLHAGAGDDEHHVDHGGDVSELVLRLHEARAPGDGRPWGPPLAETTVDTRQLPTAAHNWYDVEDQEVVEPPEVDDPEDGPDLEWWADHPEVVLNVAPSAPLVSLELAALGATLRPHRGYVLVLGVRGVDPLVVEVAPGIARAGADAPVGVSWREGVDHAREPRPLELELALHGRLRATTTLSEPAVSALRVRLHLEGEPRIEEQVPVLSQALVRDPWAGPWPGELPVLVLGGER